MLAVFHYRCTKHPGTKRRSLSVIDRLCILEYVFLHMTLRILCYDAFISIAYIASVHNF